MLDDKALDALALALAKKLYELVTDDNEVFICVHPGEDCPPDPEDVDSNLDCNRCLAEYLKPTLREELAPKEAAPNVKA